jgi:patatin-like phospholipase/acyl hydrolase
MVRILSIDGGGIRGIIPGQVLVALEEILRKKSGKVNSRIADYFDLIAGTGSGGIQACAYLLPDVINASRPKYSAEEVLKLYTERGAEIYDLPLAHRIRTVNGFLDEKYPSGGLEEVLRDYFGETWLSELIKPCLISAYDIKRRKAHFFTRHAAARAGDDFLARDVARAAGTIPTYFECSFITSRSQVHYPLIGGSLYANNPALCALAEAGAVFSGEGSESPEPADMLVLSLGTGYSRKLYPYENAKDWGLAEWSKPMIDISMAASSETVDYQMQALSERPGASGSYLRINPQIPDDMSDAIDHAAPENINALRELGAYCSHGQLKELESFADRLLAGESNNR